MDIYKYNSSRISYIDIFKGILIITVVLGHATNSTRIVFWFHMPLFFVISGLLYEEPDEIFKWIIKKTKRYLIPCIFYFGLVSIFILHDMSVKNIIKFVYGGRIIGNVWWFTTCLLLTLIILTVLVKRTSKKASILIIVVCYIIGILESNLFILKDNIKFYSYINFPWNLDVCLISLIYLSIGYFGKEYIAKIPYKIKKEKLLFSSIAMIIIIIVKLFDYLNIYNFELDMKYSHYTNPILVVIVPICFGYLFLLVSFYLDKTPLKKILSQIGRDSMAIMYLHVGMLTIFKNSFGDEEYKCIIYTIIAIMVSCVFSELVSRNKVTKKMYITGDF
ncbi:hypothetical protein CCS79_12460 [Clostridium diolis]|uniref:acyltransferase family protein n=1 Tax=Clostridium diolis TaxID=223919 RepID=UPI000B3FBE66|nr:acyltransferase family protein [Clostridium diolis]OVE67762.1 hypothetical protein CCS79_12460 [Clostridium diolis]